MKRFVWSIPMLIAIGCHMGNRSTITDKSPPGRYELVDAKANRRLTVLEIPPGQQVGMEYDHSRTPTAALILSPKSDGSLATIWRQELPKGSHYQWRAVAATTQP